MPLEALKLCTMFVSPVADVHELQNCPTESRLITSTCPLCRRHQEVSRTGRLIGQQEHPTRSEIDVLAARRGNRPHLPIRSYPRL
jgi:hypothetical protein